MVSEKDMEALETLMRSGKYSKALSVCEDIEIEMPSADMATTEAAHCFKIQMILYLIESSLSDAKHFWHRLPKSVKVEGSELARVWEAGKELWLGNISEFFRLLTFDWSNDTVFLVEALEQRVRANQFDLISNAYTSISLKQASNMLQLNAESTKKCCMDRNWPLIEVDGEVMIHPIPHRKPNRSSRNHGSISKLGTYINIVEMRSVSN